MCQPNLFAVQPADPSRAEAARETMRRMIKLLASASMPPWKDHMAAILDDGSFKRAMWLVPEKEAQILWAEYDRHATRLCANFATSD